MREVFLALFFLISGGLLCIILNRYGRLAGYISLITVLSAAFFILIKAASVLTGHSTSLYIIKTGMPLGTIQLEMDGLSLFFASVLAWMSLMTSIYSCGFMQPFYKRPYPFGAYYFFYNLLVASMLVVLVVKNAVLFLVAWELMTLASFFLVAFDFSKRSVRDGAVKYLVVMHGSGFFLIIAFLMVITKANSFDFNAFSPYMNVPFIFFLFFIGFSFKAGIFPFQSALIDAYAQAPDSISAMMSSVMKKMAFYGILRMISLSDGLPPLTGYTTMIIALFSSVAGILYALTQKDLKRVLAYSSVENAGIITIGISIGMLGMAFNNPLMTMFGFTGALLHILNHSIFKGLLFYVTGSVYIGTGTRNLEHLGGLIKQMPLTGFACLFGVLAICALPPFNGFISEFLIYSGLLRGLWPSGGMLLILKIITAAGLALSGGLVVLCFTRFFGLAFLGEPRKHRPCKESSMLMKIPMFFLSMLCLIIGFWPELVLGKLFLPLKVIARFFLLDHSFYIIMSETAGHLSRASAVFIVMIFILFLMRYFLLRKKNITIASTWRCGYGAVNSKMQYTGSAFAGPISNLLPGIHEEKRIPQDFFPLAPPAFQSRFPDHVEQFFQQKIWKGLCRGFDKLSWLQSGHVQHYIFYILFVLLCFLFATLWSIF